MLDAAIANEFLDYLDPETLGYNLPWKKRGLVKDAPAEAVSQYKEFCSLVEEANRNGIHL